MFRRRVRCHQPLLANLHASVHDFAAPLRRHLLGPGHSFVPQHGFNLASRALLIELECGFAIAVEVKVGTQFHHCAPLKATTTRPTWPATASSPGFATAA